MPRQIRYWGPSALPDEALHFPWRPVSVRCPACQEPMLAYEWEGVEIDACAACGGVWLDEGEIELIGKLNAVEPGEISQALDAPRGNRRGQRRCPRCGRKMRLITAGRSLHVDLDRCPAGHGLWFDRGEAERFASGFTSGESGAIASTFGSIFGKGHTLEAC